MGSKEFIFNFMKKYIPDARRLIEVWAVARVVAALCKYCGSRVLANQPRADRPDCESVL